MHDALQRYVIRTLPVLFIVNGALKLSETKHVTRFKYDVIIGVHAILRTSNTANLFPLNFARHHLSKKKKKKKTRTHTQTHKFAIYESELVLLELYKST